jgi:ubiquinone/menaquinone biosynthesis C-methylase UbiE
MRAVVPYRIRQMVKPWLGRHVPVVAGTMTSFGCEIVRGEVDPRLAQGWRHPSAAQRQHAAFAPVLREMRAGNLREDFIALVDAVKGAGLSNPTIMEIGCGSGWNSEVLDQFLGQSFRYVGIDYSEAMTQLGKREYPARPFVVGDACALPFRDRACDILLSGTVLMHVLGYHQAVLESVRVAKRWCIFHTIPIVTARPTTILRKLAYGTPVLEIAFNRHEFEELLDRSGLIRRHVSKNIPHAYLSEALGESITAETYLCEVR